MLKLFDISKVFYNFATLERLESLESLKGLSPEVLKYLTLSTVRCKKR